MYNVPLEVVLLLIRRRIQTLREEEDYEENQELSVKRVCRPQRLKCSGIQVFSSNLDRDEDIGTEPGSQLKVLSNCDFELTFTTMQ